MDSGTTIALVIAAVILFFIVLLLSAGVKATDPKGPKDGDQAG